MKLKNITEKDIEEAKLKHEELAKSYLKGVNDFIKWTSTVVIGSMLWISTSIAKYIGNIKMVSISSLIFLVLSLVVAILTVRRVLKSWGSEWELANVDYSFYVIKKLKYVEPDKITKEKEEEIIDDLIKKIGETKPYSNPKRFNFLVSLHIIFLVVGLILFVISCIW